MLNEVKILFDNIRSFRKRMLNESVGDTSVVDAINKRKIIYIYYRGDETVNEGARTIRPMVFGVSSAGNKVLRAWQEAGASDSAPKGNKYPDAKGRMKPGWRLFKTENITSFLPTGKYFSANDDKIANGYNPDDSQMTGGIIASVKPSFGNQTVSVTGLASPTEPNVEKNMIQTPPRSAFSTQAEKFKYFSDAAKKTRDATKEEIETLYDIGKRLRKKAPSKMLVVQNEDGDMVLKDINIQDKLPPDSIVGNLYDLYKKYVAVGKPVDTTFEDNDFKDVMKNLDQNKSF